MSNLGIEFVDRVESFRLADESDAAFSRRIGVSLTTLRDWKLLHDAGRDFEPKVRTARAVAEHLNVSTPWLLLGEGDARSGESDQQVSEVD